MPRAPPAQALCAASPRPSAAESPLLRVSRAPCRCHAALPLPGERLAAQVAFPSLAAHTTLGARPPRAAPLQPQPRELVAAIAARALARLLEPR